MVFFADMVVSLVTIASMLWAAEAAKVIRVPSAPRSHGAPECSERTMRSKQACGAWRAHGRWGDEHGSRADQEDRHDTIDVEAGVGRTKVR